jgi:hypothetical protein
MCNRPDPDRGLSVFVEWSSLGELIFIRLCGSRVCVPVSGGLTVDAEVATITPYFLTPICDQAIQSLRNFQFPDPIFRP